MTSLSQELKKSLLSKWLMNSFHEEVLLKENINESLESNFRHQVQSLNLKLDTLEQLQNEIPNTTLCLSFLKNARQKLDHIDNEIFSAHFIKTKQANSIYTKIKFTLKEIDQTINFYRNIIIDFNRSIDNTLCVS